MNARDVDSLTGFLTEVFAFSSGWNEAAAGHECEPWYRGQERASYDLIPGAYRANEKGEQWDEDTMFNRFCTEAGLLIEPHHRPIDAWEWYFAAQHYGLPTRLLDWTEDPLTALFFALRGDASDTKTLVLRTDDPPAVWMLEPSSLNAQLYENACVYVVDEQPGSTAVHWLPGRCSRGIATEFRDSKGTTSTNEWPMAIHPRRMTRRIQAQAGKFTVHGASTKAINEIWTRDAGRSDHLVKIVIRDPERVWRELSCLGFSRFRLFPEPATLADRIRKLYT